MPAHRITYDFESTTGIAATAGSKSGWSESWYIGTDQTDDVAEFQGTVLASARRGMLTPGWSLTSMRVSRLDAANNLLRKGRLVFFPPADSPGSYRGTNQDEQPYDALEVSVNSADGHHRAFSLRGIGQNVVSAGARYLDPSAFRTAFNNWLARLTGSFQPVPAAGGVLNLSPFSIRFRLLRTGPLFPNGVLVIIGVDISSTDPTFGTPISPVIRFGPIDSLAGIVPGDTIIIRDVLGMQRLNGAWRVDKVNDGVNAYIRLRPKRRTQVAGTFTRAGTAKCYGYLMDNISVASPAYGTSRKTGRPLQLVRGRRSNQVS